MGSGSELVEIELLHEEAQEKSVDGSKEVINFEEALERELAYQKSNNMRLLQPSVATRSLPTAAQSSVDSMSLPAFNHDKRKRDYGKSMKMESKQPSVGREPDHQKATEKELYEKAVKMRSLKRSVYSGLLPPASQEWLPKPNLIGMKRKTASPSYPRQPLRGFHDRQLPTRQIQDQQTSLRWQQAPPPQIKFHQPSPQQVQYQQPSRQQSEFPRAQKLDIQHSSSSEKTDTLWCSLCKVPCMNALNLEQHNQGKKHKAKLEEVSNDSGASNKQVVWCHECNIWCMNEMALAQHRIGKKHGLRLLALQRGS